MHNDSGPVSREGALSRRKPTHLMLSTKACYPLPSPAPSYEKFL